jgi:hypothetical protein
LRAAWKAQTIAVMKTMTEQELETKLAGMNAQERTAEVKRLMEGSIECRELVNTLMFRKPGLFKNTPMTKQFDPVHRS